MQIPKFSRAASDCRADRCSRSNVGIPIDLGPLYHFYSIVLLQVRNVKVKDRLSNPITWDVTSLQHKVSDYAHLLMGNVTIFSGY